MTLKNNMTALKPLSLLLAALIVSACSSPRYDYVKNGATFAQKTDALSECQYQIKLNKTPVAEQAELRQLCMQGKGYRYRQVN